MTITRTFTDGADSYAVTTNDTYSLSFRGGSDYLLSQAGTTTAYMGDGNDFVRIEGGTVRAYGGLGSDRFVDFGTGARLNGGDGNDQFDVRGATNYVFSGAAGDDRFNILTNTSAARMYGNDGNDVFSGNSHRVSGLILGGAGNDQFLDFGNYAGATVTLGGGEGNDLYRVDSNAPATIAEYWNQGVDTVQISDGGTYTLGTNLERLFVVGGGTEGAQLAGNGLANWIVGGSGGDTIDGGAGDDQLYGLRGDDSIGGGDGNDRIYGGLGIDSMAGGQGADTFVFVSPVESPYDPTYTVSDWIYDFEANDRIDLSAIDANSSVAGIQHFIVVEGAGHEQGTLYYEGDPGGWGWTTLLGYIDGDDQPDIQILVTSYIDGVNEGYPPVTADSFILG